MSNSHRRTDAALILSIPLALTVIAVTALPTTAEMLGAGSDLVPWAAATGFEILCVLVLLVRLWQLAAPGSNEIENQALWFIYTMLAIIRTPCLYLRFGGEEFALALAFVMGFAPATVPPARAFAKVILGARHNA